MAEKEVVLKVENVWKKFCNNLKRSMFYGAVDVTRNMLSIPYNQNKLRKNEFWALQDINFELHKGETLGIIGVNGSGKSTLLRLISGIFPPNNGRITINGSIGSLIAVGAGFHPHMTGRENIFLNGVILGMTKKEIKEKYNDIVDFADIGDFLEAPVSTYSSGMRVRLGFSIAVHCEPDILLVDEVLSVGDVKFQNKCYKKIDEFWSKAKSTVFISHRLREVERLCDRVIMLDKGVISAEGEPNEIIKYYLENNVNRENKYVVAFLHNEVKINNLKIISDQISKVDSNIYEIVVFRDFTFQIELINKNQYQNKIFVSFLLYNQEGALVGGKSFENDEHKFVLKENQNYINIHFENQKLNPGKYFLDVKSRDDGNNILFDIKQYGFIIKDSNNILKYSEMVGSINFETKITTNK